MKEFHLGDILSIITDKLVSPGGMEGIYDILNYMTGDDIFTHQIPRAMRECKPYLLNQYPQLRDVNIQDNKENWKEWLDKQIELYGEMLPVKPIPKDAHQAIDPIAEIGFMCKDVKDIH